MVSQQYKLYQVASQLPRSVSHEVCHISAIYQFTENTARCIPQILVTPSLREGIQRIYPKLLNTKSINIVIHFQSKEMLDSLLSLFRPIKQQISLLFLDKFLHYTASMEQFQMVPSSSGELCRIWFGQPGRKAGNPTALCTVKLFSV